MKKIVIISIILTFLFLTVGCYENKTIGRGGSGEGNIGDFYVEINDYALGYDDEGGATLGIKYLFTNNSGDTACFDCVVCDRAFQNGMQLEKIHTDETAFVNIQSGYTVEVIMGYQLLNTSDVEIELTDIMNQYDDKITKTIKISN